VKSRTVTSDRSPVRVRPRVLAAGSTTPRATPQGLGPDDTWAPGFRWAQGCAYHRNSHRGRTSPPACLSAGALPGGDVSGPRLVARAPSSSPPEIAGAAVPPSGFSGVALASLHHRHLTCRSAASGGVI